MSAETPDYKDTLFLPDTDFPMRAALPQREPEWLARWERLDVYGQLRKKPGRTPFTLHDGPPYANGHLHIGHALNKTIKDMIVRSHQMLGFDSRYVPGWDCHGLPIEWKIEEQYRAKGLNKDDVDIVAFRQECRKFAEGWVDIQREEFKRLGVTGTWNDPYLTMDYHAEAVIADEFMKFLMNGSLYQGSKPVMWSPVEKTALAEAEVEYHDVTSHQVWVRFPVVSAKDALFTKTRTDVVIWTTTPWTLPQNRAIAFGPGIAYGLYEIIGRPADSAATIGHRLVLADGLAQAAFAQAKLAGDEFIRRLCDVSAADLEGMICAHPFRALDGANGEWDYDVPMLAGEHVTDDAGTGFVHTAPSHGDDDYILGVRHGLKMTYNVEPDGTYRADLPLFGGQAIITPEGKEGPANVSVIKQLAYSGALLAKGRFKHSYPHSWRSKAPVIYRNTPQWFAAIDKPLNDGMGSHGDTIRQRALKSIEELVQFHPVSGKNRLHSMMQNRPDWVLSRQRAWGVPLTCFVKKGAKPEDEHFLLRNVEVNERIKAAFEAEGADAWYLPDANERFLSGVVDVKHGLLDPNDWIKVTDILDVWFDSGSTHAFVLRDRADGTADGIADVYMEGTDQHRGWFHSSMLQGCGTKGRAPYRNVVTHGFTLDEKGMKMSKSLGNIVAPQAVIDEYGADILRLWVAQADYTVDQRIGKEILKGTADSYRRLRNTLRYMLASLKGWDGVAVPVGEMPELERWVLHSLYVLDMRVTRGYREFDFQKVYQEIFTFMTTDLSAVFFDVRKDALYCDPASSPTRRATLTVMDALFHRLTTWLAPILPFTMEDVWLARFPGEGESVHLQDFPETPKEWLDEIAYSRMTPIRMVRSVVNACLEEKRRKKVIGSSLEASPTVYINSSADYENLKDVPLATLCITSSLALKHGEGPSGAFRLEGFPYIAVDFHTAEGAKCERCWKILPDVGTHRHPGTCARCNAALG